MQQITLMQAALAYAVAGYAVFPCKPKDKKPLTKNGVKNATTDAAIIRHWWQQNPNANIGLDTDKLLVIDVDSPEGQNWLDKQSALARWAVAYEISLQRALLHHADSSCLQY